jgi:uncharacterized protein
MAFIEEVFHVTSLRTQHRLSCIFHRKSSPYVDDQSREHVVIICHGYMSNKNGVFLPQLSRDMSDANENQFHSIRFDFHGCGQSNGRDDWDYGGYEDEARDDLRSIVEYVRNADRKYFVRALVGHSRAGTTVLLYAVFFHDIPIIINIAGRYRLDQGIVERFSQQQLNELKEKGSFIVRTLSNGDFRITQQSIDRRRQIDMKQIENIRQSNILLIWGDQDDVIPGDDIHLFHSQLQANRKTSMSIVPGANHCFTGHENELIARIQCWMTTID